MANHEAYAYGPLCEGESSATVNSLATSIEDINGLSDTDNPQTPTSADDKHKYQRGFLAELQDMKSNAILRAQGHEATMRRSFSPLAALGLGFRHVYI